MNREDRAKQFAPFEALSGLRQALHEKELKHDREQKKDISDEKAEEIAGIIAVLEKGETVEVICFESGFYIKVIDKIQKIDIINKYIVVGEGKIQFCDIYDIKRSTI